MSATRTLIDLARFVTPRLLTAALDSALRDGLTAEVTRGGHSWLERRYLELTAAAGLPQPETQRVLSRAQDRLVRVDVRYPPTRVVVELLGYRWHRSREQMGRDAGRLNALVLDGFAPMQFTYDQVVTAWPWVLGQVRSALALAA